MLCEATSIIGESFIGIWSIITFTELIFIFLSSGIVFYYYYWPSNVTFDKWRYKVKWFNCMYLNMQKSKSLFQYFQSNPAYPPVEKVRDEIIQMLKGMACSAIFPALSLYCAIKDNGLSKAFCGWGGYSLQVCTE